MPPVLAVLGEQQAGDEEAGDDEEDLDAEVAAGGPAGVEVVGEHGDHGEGPRRPSMPGR
jgi:hypothetical protein